MLRSDEERWTMSSSSGRCACGCNGDHAGKKKRAAWTPIEPIVMLASAGGITRVDLRELAQVRVDDSLRACLADVWVASRLSGDLLELQFDLVGEDGFRAGSRGPAVPGVVLARGYIDVRTLDVSWDPRLEMECFYHVKRLGALVVSDAARVFTWQSPALASGDR
jgi:hypothetical protein